MSSRFIHAGAVYIGEDPLVRVTSTETSRSFFWEDFGRQYHCYVTGECMDFALALAEEFPGWEMVSLAEDHFALWDGEYYYDIRGRLTEEDFRKGFTYGDGPIGPADIETVKLHAGLAGQDPPYKTSEFLRAQQVLQGWLEWYDYMEETEWDE